VSDILRWDAMQLPVRDGCVDAVVVDLPFGNLCGKASANHRRLYPCAVAECARVLRPGGRAVFMTTMKNGLLSIAEEHSALWAVEEIRPVNIGGLCPVAVVMRRLEGAGPPDGVGGDLDRGILLEERRRALAGQ
jgi:ubiquinone/menaquinone biosynthesis C-methylase UbiE